MTMAMNKCLLIFMTGWMLMWVVWAAATTTASSINSNSGSHRSSWSQRIPGHSYAVDEDEPNPFLGREFDLFDTRGGTFIVNQDDVEEEVDATTSSSSSSSAEESQQLLEQPTSATLRGSSSNAFSRARTASAFSTSSMPPRSSYYASSQQQRSRRRQAARYSTGSSSAAAASSSSGAFSKKPAVFQNVQDWWTTNISPNIKNWPKLQLRVEPTTTLKIRKTFRPLKTIVRLGADFNTQLGVWQFKSSWEDAIIGGKLTLAGRELQLTKSWQLSVGAMEDLVTRLRFRAAVDLQTWKAYARVGFRTERLSPINIMEGFTLVKQLPLDGNKGHIKLEVKANFALPEPEIEYSTETHRSLIGMGDIEINIDELNLVLDY